MIERLLEAGHPGQRLQPDPLQARASCCRRSRRRPSRLPTWPASEVVFTSVASSKDLLAVTPAAGGSSRWNRPPQVIVDVTTVSAEASATCGKEAAESGTEVLAAPASGNPGAVQGGCAPLSLYRGP